MMQWFFGFYVYSSGHSHHPLTVFFQVLPFHPSLLTERKKLCHLIWGYRQILKGTESDSNLTYYIDQRQHWLKDPQKNVICKSNDKNYIDTNRQETLAAFSLDTWSRKWKKNFACTNEQIAFLLNWFQKFSGKRCSFLHFNFCFGS